MGGLYSAHCANPPKARLPRLSCLDLLTLPPRRCCSHGLMFLPKLFAALLLYGLLFGGSAAAQITPLATTTAAAKAAPAAPPIA